MLGILLFMYFGWAAMDKGQPLRHAGICVGLGTALSLLFGGNVIETLIAAVIAFAYTWLVYWLVDRWRDQILVPLTIMITATLLLVTIAFWTV